MQFITTKLFYFKSTASNSVVLSQRPKSYEYNVSKAKELLIQAGYPNGFETELWTLPVSRPYNPDGRKWGEMMQADLAKVGIKVKLVTYDWSTYLEKNQKWRTLLSAIGMEW